MAKKIRGPKGAHPTARGWVNPKTGELLKCQKISQAAIDEWFGVVEQTPPAAEVDLESMTKAELETFGRGHGVELDRRKTKDKLISRLKGILPTK